MIQRPELVGVKVGDPRLPDYAVRLQPQKRPGRLLMMDQRILPVDQIQIQIVGTQFFTGLMTILGTLLFMVSINPLITLVVVVLTPISLFAAGSQQILIGRIIIVSAAVGPEADSSL